MKPILKLLMGLEAIVRCSFLLQQLHFAYLMKSEEGKKQKAVQ